MLIFTAFKANWNCVLLLLKLTSWYFFSKINQRNPHGVVVNMLECETSEWTSSNSSHDEWENKKKRSWYFCAVCKWWRKKNKWLLTLSLQVTNYANFLFSLTEPPMKTFAALIKSCVCFYQSVLSLNRVVIVHVLCCVKKVKFFFFFLA